LEHLDTRAALLCTLQSYGCTVRLLFTCITCMFVVATFNLTELAQFLSDVIASVA